MRTNSDISTGAKRLFVKLEMTKILFLHVNNRGNYTAVSTIALNSPDNRRRNQVAISPRSDAHLNGLQNRSLASDIASATSSIENKPKQQKTIHLCILTSEQSAAFALP
jgi:hypothetical protein